MTKDDAHSSSPGIRSVMCLAMVLVAGCILGCGDEGDEQKRVASMLPTSTQGVEDRASTSSNSAPTIESIDFSPANPAPGRVVESRARVTDADGDSTRVEYRWQTSGGDILGEGRRFDTTGLEEGARIRVTAIADDGKEKSSAFSKSLRLAESSTEVSLVAIDTGDQGTAPGVRLRAIVESTKGRWGDYEELLEWRVNGERVGTEDELDTSSFSPGDIVTLRARLETSLGRISRAVTSKPVVLAKGGAPEILSEPTEGIEGGLFSYQIQARSPVPSATIRFELLEGPEGMTVDADTGLVQWRPASSQRGRFEIEVAAKDQWGAGVAQSFALEADGPTAPPARAR